MPQFVLPSAFWVALALQVVSCSIGETHEAAPRPQLGIVRTDDDSCTGTRLGPGEVLTAASCLGGAPARSLSFEPLDGGKPTTVEWVTHGIDSKSPFRDDWAILSLSEDAGRDIGARHLGALEAEAPEPSTRLWWAAVADRSERIETGFCRALTNRHLPGNIELTVLEHDCELDGTRPGALLYSLIGDELAPIAFQGRDREAIPIASFSDAPVPITDVFVGTETFLGVPISKVYALDRGGRLNARLELDGNWLMWSQLDEGNADLVKLDGAAEPRDFAHDALVHVWALDSAGSLHVYDVTRRVWERDASSHHFVDLSVSGAPGQVPRLFALTHGGQVCTRPGSPGTSIDWSCGDSGGTGTQLDSAALAAGHLVVIVLPADLVVVRFVDDAWQEPESIGEEGTYRVATVASTTNSIPYVVARRTDRLRITVGDASGENWAPWSPLFGAGEPGVVSSLDAGQVPGRPAALYAVVAGELFMASELPEATVERWSRDVASPAEFGSWHRIESFPDE